MWQIREVGSLCPVERSSLSDMTPAQRRQHQKRENDPLIQATRAVRRKMAMATWHVARRRSRLTPLAIQIPGSNVWLFPSCRLRDMAELFGEDAQHDANSVSG